MTTSHVDGVPACVRVETQQAVDLRTLGPHAPARAWPECVRRKQSI